MLFTYCHSYTYILCTDWTVLIFSNPTSGPPIPGPVLRSVGAPTPRTPTPTGVRVLWQRCCTKSALLTPPSCALFIFYVPVCHHALCLVIYCPFSVLISFGSLKFNLVVRLTILPVLLCCLYLLSPPYSKVCFCCKIIEVKISTPLKGQSYGNFFFFYFSLKHWIIERFDVDICSTVQRSKYLK